MIRTAFTFFLLAAATLGTVAHPGHGHENPLSPGHYTGNPEHALPLAFTVAVATVLIVWGVVQVNRYLQKERARKS